jgi:hemerythrin-like domain-containing protein
MIVQFAQAAQIEGLSLRTFCSTPAPGARVVGDLVLAFLLHSACYEMLNLDTYKPRNESIENLVKEHALISNVLDAFDRWAEALLIEGREDRLALKRFLCFFGDFVDGAHHRKEEKVLFAVMLRYGFQDESGPIAVMNWEHEEGRALMQDLAALADQSGAWDKETCGEINAQATTYVTLLRNHIQKEDQVLYPMADARLPGEAWSEIADGFAQIDEENECSGMYYENLALAEHLIVN